MDRQAIIRNAFKFPELLDEELIAELVRQMSKDASLRQRNMRRLMNVGEVIEDRPKQQKFNSKKPRINRRELTDKEKSLLLRAWG